MHWVQRRFWEGSSDYPRVSPTLFPDACVTRAGSTCRSLRDATDARRQQCKTHHGQRRKHSSRQGIEVVTYDSEDGHSTVKNLLIMKFCVYTACSTKPCSCDNA